VRSAFFQTLMELAEVDERIYLLVGDLGFGVVEPFLRKFPKRFVNVGVAEQNLTGLAAGIASTGAIVFTYSIANFPVLRCLEHIRNDVCYHRANVKIVSIGGGYSYGALGMTHHSTEDLAVLRALPEMTVVAPGDPYEAREATRAVVAHEGPCYLRLGRAGEPIVHTSPVEFRIGKAIQVRSGDALTLISTGALLQTAVTVADRLESAGVSTRVLSMHTLKPLDVGAVLKAARETHAVITLEEHSIIGGLGGAVAECLAEEDHLKVPFRRLGIPPAFCGQFGSQDYLRSRSGLSPEGIMASLEPLLQMVRT